MKLAREVAADRTHMTNCSPLYCGVKPNLPKGQFGKLALPFLVKTHFRNSILKLSDNCDNTLGSKYSTWVVSTLGDISQGEQYFLGMYDACDAR